MRFAAEVAWLLAADPLVWICAASATGAWALQRYGGPPR